MKIARILFSITLIMALISPVYSTVSAPYFDGFEDGERSEYTTINRRDTDSWDIEINQDRSYRGNYAAWVPEHSSGGGAGSEHVRDLVDYSRIVKYEMKFNVDHNDAYIESLIGIGTTSDGDNHFFGWMGTNNVLDHYSPEGGFRNKYGSASLSEDKWYRLVVKVKKEGWVFWEVIDPSNGNSIEQYNNTSIEITDLKVGFGGEHGAADGDVYMDNLNVSLMNQAPEMNSISTTPENWQGNESVSITVNASDSDGQVKNVTVDVWGGGSRIENDIILSENSDLWEGEELFSVNKSDVFYNISISMTDENDATTVEWLNRSVVSTSLEWEDNSENEAGFNIYSNKSREDFQQIGSTSANEENYEYVSSAVNFSSSRCFRVTSFNSYGESSPLQGCIVP